MAHVFSNTDGSIGTIILVSARSPERFVPENATYHGDLEIPSHDYPAALRHDNGSIIEDHNEVKVIKLAEIEARHDMLREEFRTMLHDMDLGKGSAADLDKIRDDAAALSGHRDAVVTELNRRTALSTIKNVNHLEFDHNGDNLNTVVVPPNNNINI